MILAIKSPVTNPNLISMSVLPTLLQDIFDVTDKWGNGEGNGRIDPFTDINGVSPPS